MDVDIVSLRASRNSTSSVGSSTYSSRRSTFLIMSPEPQQQQQVSSSTSSSFSATMIEQQQKQQHSSSTPTNHLVGRNITNKPITMKGHLAKYKLPFWVRLVQGNLHKNLHALDLFRHGPESNSSLGYSVPLQVLEIRRRKLVIARKMQWERKVQDYVVTGKNLQISIDFKGWFEVIPDDGRPVEYFDTIQGITAIKPRKFLVRTSIVGYELGEENGIPLWVPREISLGEVLTTGMVYMDYRKTSLTANMKNLFRRILKYGNISTKRDEDLKYLQCFDSKGLEIMIPLITTGVFSPIGDPKEKNYDAVYELKDLTMAFELPIKAQLVHADSHQKYHVPHGVLKLESFYEDDCVMVSKSLDRRDCFELPLDEDLRYIKDIAPKSIPLRKLSTRSMTLPAYSAKTLNESGYKPKLVMEKSQIDLPLRVPSKDSRKPKSPGIIERLSTRKTKKERAALKALQEEGIFSSRLSKVEMPFDAFYTTSNYFQKTQRKDSENSRSETMNGSSGPDSPTTPISSASSPSQSPSDPQSPVSPKPSSVVDPFEDQYAKVCRKVPLQKRVLPPVPLDVRDDSETGTIVDENENLSLSSNDTLYEHLPAAPIPPTPPPPPPYHSGSMRHSDSSCSIQNDNQVDSEEDGYMIPSHLNGRKERYRQRSANPTLTRQSGDAKSYSTLNSQIDIPMYANFKEKSDAGKPSANSKIFKCSKRIMNDNKIFAASTSDLSQFAPNMPSVGRRFVRRNSAATDYQMSRDKVLRNLDGYYPPPPPEIPDMPNSHGNLYPGYDNRVEFRRTKNADPNFTVRHHNIQHLKNAMEVFHFTDSFHEARPLSYGSQGILEPTNESLNESNVYPPLYSSCATPNHFTYLERNDYPESDPGKQYFVRSLSVTGLSDHCVKQGDDSAISLCSKGDYGFQGGSDYSYSEYCDVFHDDGWLPPDNIGCLSVQDVSRSLRYIGMKDRVVKRFANEQIDGQMLASLDWKLLKDGFPELNTLEVKKILDFINGWRPKKSIS